MKVMIDPKRLKKGMYVSELDRPWLESPFLFQGFRITNSEELSQLEEICSYVLVDSEKSAIPIPDDISELPMRNTVKRKQTADYIKEPEPYQASFEQEYASAKEVYNLAQYNVVNLFKDTKMGQSLDVAEAKYTVTSMVDSVMRHPDALILLASLRDKSDQAVAHAVSVCTLAITFGRYLGFKKSQLKELGIGALLHDIGETRVPDDVLSNYAKNSKEELSQFQDHTTYGAAILHKIKGLPESVISIARDHHERTNGSGYPQQLTGNNLDLLTMVVAIVDVYDNVTSGMYGKPSLPCTEALKNIYVWRDDLFDSLLVEKFIQCLGIYPVGSVVELKTGELGIVISTNPETRLLPTILLIRNARKKPVEPPRILNLALFVDKNSKTKQYEVKRVVKPEDYNIDIRNYILRELPLKSV